MSEQDDSPKKTMSFKDRIAMFNQPKAAAPAPGPPPRATKPRAFKWKTSGEAEEDSSSNKTVSVADVPPPAPTPTPATAVPLASAQAASEQQPAALTDKPGAPTRTASTTSSSGAPLEAVSSRASVVSAEDSVKHKGFSAEDAKQTAGSLRERIALLSGLKVDKPDAPGRAPKPWRKKTQEPEEAEEQQTSAVESTATSTDAQAGDATSSGDLSQAETGETTKVQDETETPVISAVTLSAKATDSAPEHGTATSPSESQGIALPAMPTRARGPQRKARSGGAATSAASPTVQPPTDAPSSSVAAAGTSNEDTLSVTDKGGSTAGLEESSNPTSVADVKKDEEGQQDLDTPKKTTAGSFTDDTPPTRAPPKRASTSLIAQGIPLPPASNAAEREDNLAEREESTRGSVEHADEISKITSGIAKQSIDDGPTSESAPAPVASPIARPPAPPALDTQAASQVSSFDSPEMASPRSASTNRRSMNRPPIPSAYSQDTPSPRSSFDNRSQRSSIVESNRGSLIMSPTQPELITAEPEAMAGRGNLEYPDVGRKDKEALPPPSSKPSDAQSATNVESPTSPTRRDSMTIAQQKRQSGAPAAVMGDNGTAPARTDSVMSQSSVQGTGADRDEGRETNIDAMRAYRPPQEETDEGNNDGDDGEYEDPEVARRQALAKRMAAMGGMKLGMLPQMPSMVKRKKPEPREEESTEKSEAPLSPPPVPPPAALPVEPAQQQETREESPTRPPVQSAPSYKPPAGAFVLPMMGRPPVPPPSVPPPPAPEEEEEEEQEQDEDREEEEEDEDQDRDEQQEYEEDTPGAGDDTVTQPMEDTEPLTPLPPPPPVPAARPPPPPPSQSFIETDTDTDGGRSEKRASLASSTGMGSLSDFPAPPAGESHMRTQSSASRYSLQGQSETLYEEPDAHEDYDNRSEQTETIPPPRPARRAPTLDTSVDSTTAGGGNPPSRRESMAEPASPARSTHSYNQRSLPETPISPSGQGTSQERFGALSPTTSQSSRRSSAMLSGQQQGGPAPAPGLNNEYLTYIAHNSSKTKSREVDGPLAHTLNDIAYTYRNDPAGFGAPVYRVFNSGVKGQTPELEIHGRIDAGCVFFAWDAKFDRGLGRSSLKVGSAEVPHVGIIAEAVKDIKKAKVKVVELVQGRHNVEVYKLDDLKSGTVEIRRLP